MATLRPVLSYIISFYHRTAFLLAFIANLHTNVPYHISLMSLVLAHVKIAPQNSN